MIDAVLYHVLDAVPIRWWHRIPLHYRIWWLHEYQRRHHLL